MRKILCICLAMFLLCLSGCGTVPAEPTTEPITMPTTESTTAPTTEATTTPTTEATTTPTTEATTAPTTAPTTEATTAPTETQPVSHSEYYISGLDVDTLIRYFNEVVLDAEFSDSGNASLVQKWDRRVIYYINGEPTDEDMRFLESTASWLNSIPGFPGMMRTENSEAANLQIYFTDAQGLVNLMGDRYSGCDGGVTFWYDYNRINRGIICYRADIDQYVRNSVIQEEIYNGMGPVQDTNLRTDSMIYSGYSTPQQMTAVDKLIMTLLYHPSIDYGMTKAECEKVIRQLYY